MVFDGEPSNEMPPLEKYI